MLEEQVAQGKPHVVKITQRCLPRTRRGVLYNDAHLTFVFLRCLRVGAGSPHLKKLFDFCFISENLLCVFQDVLVDVLYA